MAQADGVVANGTGSAVRADINGQLAALFTNHSGSTEPATTFAFQTWADTNTNTLKLRNSSNDGWVQLARLDGQFDAKTFNGNVTLNAQSDLRLADSDSSNWVAFQAPATVASNVTWTLPAADGTSGQTLQTNGSGTLSWSTPSASVDIISEGNTSAEVVDTGSDGHFKVVTEGTEALRVNASQQVGINTNNPGAALDVRARDLHLGATSGGAGLITFRRDSGAQYGLFGWDSGSDVVMRWTNDSGSGSLAFNTNSAERARIDSSGRLLVGTSTARTNINNQSWPGFVGLNVEGAANYGTAINLVNNNSGNAYGMFNFLKSNTTSIGSNTLVASGDTVGMITFQGNDGTEFVQAAAISAVIASTPGANDMPGRLNFSTTADGASSPTLRIGILNTGNVLFYNQSQVSTNSDNVTTLGASGARWSAVWAANGTIQTSDERLKTEVSNASLGSDFIKALRPVSYKWIEGGKRDSGERDEENNWIYESVPGQRTHWGFIAQEVKEAVDQAGVDFGGWVLGDKDDPESTQSLRYDQFIAPLTKALQEALAKIETLEARLTALEGGA